MNEQAFSISLQGQSSADESDYVIIEQEPWGKDVGRTSSSQGVLAIGVMIFGDSLFGGLLPLPNCGDADGLEVPVYVYPSRPDLNYVFGISHGEASHALAAQASPDINLGAGKPTGVISVVTREETVQCGFQDSAETNYPVEAMFTQEWLGPCYDQKGNEVARPGVVRRGRKLFFGSKVYGAILVRYSVYRVTYTVHIDAREDSLENNFQSVAFCRWDGGVEYKEIQSPSGYELTLGDCDNGKPDGSDGSTGICPDQQGRGSRPVAVQADRLTKIDYCSQLQMSDEITESVDTDNVPGEECNG